MFKTTMKTTANSLRKQQMKVKLHADSHCAPVKSMVEQSTHVNWLPISTGQSTDKTILTLYVISPKQLSGNKLPTCIGALIDDSNKKPKQTLFCYIKEEDNLSFTPHQIKSLDAIGKMIRDNGAIWLESLPTTEQQWQQTLADSPE
jgi:citrate lyase synthetase